MKTANKSPQIFMKNINNLSRIIMVALIVILGIVMVFISKNKTTKPVYAEGSGFYFDTFITIRLYYDSEDSYNSQTNMPEEYFDSAIKELLLTCGYYEGLISKTIKTSDISILNTNKTATVNSFTYELLAAALKYSEETSGLFDMTIGTVLKGFSIQEKTIYDKATTAKLLDSIDYKNVHLEKADHICRATITNPETTVDLGGIAKGYIADKLKEILLDKGINSFIINLGGNILVNGTKGNEADYDGYTIGIQYPFKETGENITTIKLHNKSAVTSGIYQRYFFKDNAIYHHLFNPYTGYPENNDLYSVTIISDSSTDCDSFSTAVYLMGLSRGIEFINNHPELEAIFVDKNNNIHLSAGLLRDSNNIIFVKK